MQAPLIKTLQNSRNYTLQVAEAMPEKLYDSKPAGAGWNFREQLHHIAYGIQWWENNYMKGNKTDWQPPATKKNKKEIMAYLNEAYDGLQQTLEQGKLSADAVQGFHATIDHITHHRGQAVLHLHVQEIEPPEYTY
ncbi:DinB family protein [Pseudoflavitalea sp. X16]|uniref:DinB family protein n=1 Tax=Paraflavitalea devenefica TaxID=2716334 RepID=UPI001423D1AB|nr:DinB family protein [Paraflavitalea devenefica]NII29108.1 DinB family protein [Paraflavitalea devenefica]